MADRPGTPLEKYYAHRTQAVQLGTEWDSEECKESVCRHFVLNGLMRSSDVRLEIVRRQPVEHFDLTPERRSMLKALDPEATQLLEMAKAEAEAASMQASSQAMQTKALQDELAAMRAMNMDLLSRLESGAGVPAPAPVPPSMEPDAGSSDGPAGWTPPPSPTPDPPADPAAVQKLPALDTYREMMADTPQMSWTKAQMLSWGEGKGIPVSEELKAAGTKTELLEHLLENRPDLPE